MSFNRIIALTAVLIILTGFPQTLFADGNVTKLDQGAEEEFHEQLNKEKKQQRWSAFPIIASNPEVGVMLGGMLFHFFPTEKADQQASTIDLYAFGTTEGQYLLAITPNLFLADNTYKVSATFSGNYWRANFYPIGNNSQDDKEQYDSTNYGISVNAERYFFNSFTLGFIGRYTNSDMDIESGGMLDSGDIYGAKDGEYTGAGLTLGYDTRDNTNAPHRGAFAQYQYINYNKNLGSSLDFDSHALDLRYYFKSALTKDSIVALAAKMQSTTGDVPFRYLPSPDGTFILRGIENGRYKDRRGLSFQTEYRFPVKGKFSGTVFADFAQVANEFDDMSLDKTKTSIGTGFRYALNPEQRFNVRADFAWVDGGFGMIINVREAF